MAYRQGLRAPRRPGSTARHQQRYTPTTQNDSNHGPKEVCCTPYRELRSERCDVSNSKSPPAKQRPQQPQPQPQPQPQLSPQGPPGQTQTQCSIQHMRQEQQQLQVQTASAYDEDEELGTEDIPTDDIIYIDIELDDGTVATVGIAPEEDPEAVACEFVQDHQLADHYVQLLAKYLKQTLSETSNIAVLDNPPHRPSPLLAMSLESVTLTWKQQPSLASIRNRHVLIVQLHNNQNFDWNEIVGSQRQTDMLTFQDVFINNGRMNPNRKTIEFGLLMTGTSLILPHGRKPMVNIELWQINRRDMIALGALREESAGMLDTLQASGKLLATAAFVTNNDEFDGNGSAMLQDASGSTIGNLAFSIRRTAVGSR